MQQIKHVFKLSIIRQITNLNETDCKCLCLHAFVLICIDKKMCEHVCMCMWPAHSFLIHILCLSVVLLVHMEKGVCVNI